MSPPVTDPSFTPTQFKRAWRYVTLSGMFGIFYFTVEYLSAARVGFLTELKATPFDFGLIAAIYALAFGFQLVCGALINHMSRRKPWFILAALAHRVLFLAVPLAPFIFTGERPRIWFIVAVMVLHDTILQMATPLYYSWMADLVPPGAINRHWGARQRFITLSTILGNLALAIGLYYFEVGHQVIRGFLVFGALATLSGVMDILFFSRVPEPPNQRAPRAALREVLTQPLRDPAFRTFLQFMVFWFAVTMLASPFFFVYMREHFGMSILGMQLMMVAEALGGMISARFWGLICDAYGQENGIQLSLVAKAVCPLTAILVAPYPALAVPAFILAFFIDGLMNSGFLLAWQGVVLKSTPRLNRSMYIGATNFLCQGLAGGIAPFVAGWAIGRLNVSVHFRTGPIRWDGYLIIFAASTVLRLAAWPIAWRMQAAAAVPFRTMMNHLMRTNPIKVTQALYQLHGSPLPDRRIHAAMRLARLRSPLAIGSLIDALQDPVRGVREAAAEALGKIGMAEAREPLARVLHDPALGIQSPAAAALGRIGGPDSLHALLTSLDGMDAEALNETIEALARIGDSAAILPLICLFEKVENPVLRRRIADVLGRLTRRTDSEEEVLADLTASAR